MKNCLLKGLLAAASLSSAPAFAGVTISVGPHIADATQGKLSPLWGGANVFMETFDLPGGGCGLNAPASSVSGGPWGIVQGSVSGAYAAPAGDSSCYAYAPPSNGAGLYPGSSLPPGLPANVLSSVNIDYSPLLATLPAGTFLNYFGLYYGSIDNYNQLTFYSGNTLVATVSGASILAACGGCTPGDRSSDATNAFVNLYFTDDVEFTRLTFETTGVAVEVDNLTVAFAPVPEPSTLLLLCSGLAGIGLVAQRRTGRRG